MGALKDWLDGTRAKLLWIECSDYATQVIGGQSAWESATGIASMLGQAQGLIETDILSIDAARILFGTSPGESNPGLERLIASLADPARVEILDQTVEALAHGVNAELMLQLPSPSAALKLCGAEVEQATDFGNLDDTGAAYADLIRGLAGKPLGGVTFTVSSRMGDDEIDALGPVVACAEHYDWQVVSELTYLANEHADELTDACAATVGALVLLPEVTATNWQQAEPKLGGGLDEMFWRDAAMDAPKSSLQFGRIPADAVPELVLAQRSRLG